MTNTTRSRRDLTIGLPSLIALFLLLSVAEAEEAADPAAEAPQLRRPVAQVLSKDERWLYVANRESGTVSVVDLRARQVAAEQSVGRRLAEMAGLGDDTLLVVDEQQHQLIVVRTEGPRLSVVRRIEVPRHPVSLAVLAGRRVIVSSLWSRRLSRIDLAAESDKVAVLDLPWAPRELLPLPGGQLLVGDAFTGRLGLVDPERLKLLHTRQFPAHNIRGLALSADESKVLVAHQMLNEMAHTVRNDVHWGLLMSNDLRYMPLDALLDPESDLYQGSHMHPLGEAGSATSDPSAVAVAADGTAVITLGGVGEIAMGKEEEFSLSRMEVGRRPTDVVVFADSRRAAVANTFDDSISLVDLEDREAETISLGEQPALTLAQRGELLFYDGELSHDRWMSCHSCHPDGHTNGQLNDNLSDFSTFGAPKRVLSLLGRRDTAPFAWNGAAKDMAAQIANSITHTMQSDQDPRPREVEALASYLATLEPPPPLDAARGTTNRAAVRRGAAVFESQGCSQCHAAPAYTSAATYDVGLEDELGRREFNPPPLRGVSQRGPFFHDGRAKSLREVFQKHRHQLEQPLSDSKMADLLAFLRSL